jgi:hypothetical protein
MLESDLGVEEMRKLDDRHEERQEDYEPKGHLDRRLTLAACEPTRESHSAPIFLSHSVPLRCLPRST